MKTVCRRERKTVWRMPFETREFVAAVNRIKNYGSHVKAVKAAERN